MAMKKKYALVLSGGGFKGAFQLGVLNYMRENWHRITGEDKMHFDIIAGVSVGSLNGALMAMNQLDKLNELWNFIADKGTSEVYTSDFIDTSGASNEVKLNIDFDHLKQRFFPNFTVSLGLWKGLSLLFSKKKREEFFKAVLGELGTEVGSNLKKFKALADNTPLYDKLQQYINRDAIPSNTKFYCGFTSLYDGDYHGCMSNDFATNEDFIQAILASTAMPIVWTPVRNIQLKNGTVYKESVDGGIVNVSPLGDVIAEIDKETNPDVEYTIFIIDCNSGASIVKPEATDYNIGKIALRSLEDIAITEIFKNDLEQFLRINDLVNQSAKTLYYYDVQMQIRTDRPLKYFKHFVINPDADSLGETLIANRQLTDMRIEHGRQKAIKIFSKAF